MNVNLTRVKKNTNLKIYTDGLYKGLKVNNNGNLIENYLSRLYDATQKSLSEYSHTFAFRFDLSYPRTLQYKTLDDGRIIKTFIDSFKAQIKADRKRIAKDKTKRLHDTKVRYIWCKEIEKSKQCHFHFVIMLNNSAYNTKGALNSENPKVLIFNGMMKLN